jgi:hypothetical protein
MSFPKLPPYVPHHAGCPTIGSISGNEAQRPAAIYCAFPGVLFGILRTSPGFIMGAATTFIQKDWRGGRKLAYRLRLKIV